MKQIKWILLLGCYFITSNAPAQVWTGNINSDWSNPGNWNPGTVPISGAVVTIPGTAPNWPVLKSTITLSTLLLEKGGHLDLDGYKLMLGGAAVNNLTMNGAILGGGVIEQLAGGVVKLNDCTINGNLVINMNADGSFSEADAQANTFNGDLTVNMNTAAVCWLSYNKPSFYHGNVIVNRTALGGTWIFHSGFAKLDGDFTYTNSVGGPTFINLNKVPSAMAGKVKVDYVSSVGNPDFVMNNITNTAPGGYVRVKSNSTFSHIRKVDMEGNNLQVDSVALMDVANGKWQFNTVTGKWVVKGVVPSTTGHTFSLDENIINGPVRIGITGLAFVFTDNGNTFNNDVEYIFEGSGNALVSVFKPSVYQGSLSIQSRHTGIDELFPEGFAALNGNFSYSAQANVETYINRDLKPTAAIGGSLMIHYQGTNEAKSIFSLSGISYAGAGSKISVSNCWMYNIGSNSLTVDSFIVRDVGSAVYNEYSLLTFTDNTISGHLILADAAFIRGKTSVARNTIGGNCTFTVNGAQNLFVEEGNNIFNGHVEYDIRATGPKYIGQNFPSAYHGNVTVNRTQPGATYIFDVGFLALDGNFTYSNTSGGPTYINQASILVPPVGGMVNINSNAPSGYPPFTMSRIKNAGAGGAIMVQNSGTVKFLFDTLVVNDLSVTGFTNTGGESGFVNNHITGNLLFSDAGTNTGNMYIYGNTFAGTSHIKVNAAANLYQGYYTKDVFNGNLLVERNGTGNISLSFTGPVYVNGDLTLKSNAGISFTDTVSFGGAGAAFKQLGTQPVTIPKMRMQKAAAASLSLASPITISNKLTFVSGIIDCTTIPLYFAGNATHEGATATSHAKGEVVKTGNDPFTFPLGSGTTLNTIAITAPANITDIFSARYYARNPSQDGYDTKLFQKLTPTPVQLVSGCEYWNLTRLNGNSNVGLTFGYGHPICPGGSPAYITDPAKMRIVHWNGSLWEDLGNGGHTGATEGTLTTGATVSNFSPFTLASTDVAANPLPLTLLAFRAYRKEPGVQLEWETVNEVNVSHYGVQRARSNNLFETIDSIPAFNTPERHRYKTLDLSPHQGNNYYRLKNVDKDGRTTFTKTVLVKMEQLTGLQLWPNPAYSDQPVRLLIPGNTGLPDLVLINSQGQVARRWNAFHTASPLPISDLPAGVYLLQVRKAGEVQTLKMVIR